MLLLTSTLAERSIAGMGVETPVAGVARVDGLGWYGLTFAASRVLTDAENIAVAGYIEGASAKHLFGINTNNAPILDPSNTADICSQLSLADYMRTFVQYSNQDPNAVSSWFGRAFTVNFEGSNTTITMKFKKEPGILPEVLTATQATTLANKRCNVYAMYNNGVAITQEGVMSGLAFFDEMLIVTPKPAVRQLLFDPEDQQPLEQIKFEVSTQLADRVSDRSAQSLQIKTERPDINREGYIAYREAKYIYHLGKNVLRVSHKIDWCDVMTDEMATSLINTIDALIPGTTSPIPQPEHRANQETRKSKALQQTRRKRPPG
jgi:hypothetical protein